MKDISSWGDPGFFLGGGASSRVVYRMQAKHFALMVSLASHRIVSHLCISGGVDHNAPSYILAALCKCATQGYYHSENRFQILC